MELTFVCMGKKSVSAESAEYFLNVGFVLDVSGSLPAPSLIHDSLL